MNGSIARVAIALAVAATVSATELASSQPAHGAGSHGLTDAELTIAAHIASGNYTADELVQARQDAALADIAEDPDPAAVTDRRESQLQANAGLASIGKPTHTAGSSACPQGSKEHFMGHSWTHHSLLGSTIYKWHWDVWFCRNANTDKITSWTHRADFVTNVQWMVSWTKDQTTVLDSLPAVKGKAYRERHLQLCYVAKFGCANRYPWGRGTAYGVGYDPYFTGDDG